MNDQQDYVECIEIDDFDVIDVIEISDEPIEKIVACVPEQGCCDAM